MKKIKGFATAFLSLALALFCFAACGERVDGAVGSYRIHSVSVGGTVYNVGDRLPDVMGGGVISAEFQTMELKADGSLVTLVSSSDGTVVNRGRWERAEGESKYLFTIEGREVSALITGGRISMTEGVGENAVTLVFEKK